MACIELQQDVKRLRLEDGMPLNLIQKLIGSGSTMF
jgi:hypothetical protein